VIAPTLATSARKSFRGRSYSLLDPADLDSTVSPGSTFSSPSPPSDDSHRDLLARHKGKAHPSDENPPPLVKGKRAIKGNKPPAVSAVGGKLAAKERRESEERERKGRMCTECQARDLECDLGRPCG
jgi:hypothetical protein